MANCLAFDVSAICSIELLADEVEVRGERTFILRFGAELDTQFVVNELVFDQLHDILSAFLATLTTEYRPDVLEIIVVRFDRARVELVVDSPIFLPAGVPYRTTDVG